MKGRRARNHHHAGRYGCADVSVMQTVAFHANFMVLVVSRSSATICTALAGRLAYFSDANSSPFPVLRSTLGPRLAWGPFLLCVADGFLTSLRLIVSAEGDSTTITANPDVEPEEPCIEESILPSAAAKPIPTKLSPDEVHAQTDLPDVTFRFSEKRRLNWSNETCMWSLSDTLTRDKQIPPRSRTVDYRRKSGEWYDRFSSRHPLNPISSPLYDFASHLVLTLPAVKVSVCCAVYSRRVQGTVRGLGDLFPCRF